MVLPVAASIKDVALRSPEKVMRLARLGSFHQCRLSFMRTLLRRLKRDSWTFERQVFDIDSKGVGTAVYCAHGPDHSYSLVCFGHDLPDEQRSDRVIAHAWDSTFTLFDGVPTEADIERLSQSVPLQEAGRVSSHELSVSRANRSVRLFNHVVDSLSAGQQPDAEQVETVGYLMRTSAVYGSGKLGAADRELIADRAEFAAPFQCEMLSVFLTRAYTLDLVEHMALLRAPETAVALEPSLRRRFAVGNSTGLGMAPFLINHPALIHQWIAARETALIRVRELASASDLEQAVFLSMVRHARRSADAWRSVHPLQLEKLEALKSDLRRLSEYLTSDVLEEANPWDTLFRWGEAELSMEGQEQLISLMLEPYGDLVDDLAETMSIDESSDFTIDGSMSLEQLRNIIEEVYDFALHIDWLQPEAYARVWYISDEKLEPRLGQRFEEDLEFYEQRLCPGRDAASMYQEIKEWDLNTTVSNFLLAMPKHRHIVRRAQIASRYRYAEVRDNTVSASLLPIDLLRCKLSFFGATHFDPRSDRWLRINMFQGAPFPHELSGSKPNVDVDVWAYPDSHTQPKLASSSHKSDHSGSMSSRD